MLSSRNTPQTQLNKQTQSDALSFFIDSPLLFLPPLLLSSSDHTSRRTAPCLSKEQHFGGLRLLCLASCYGSWPWKHFGCASAAAAWSAMLQLGASECHFSTPTCSTTYRLFITASNTNILDVPLIWRRAVKGPVFLSLTAAPTGYLWHCILFLCSARPPARPLQLSGN